MLEALGQIVALPTQHLHRQRHDGQRRLGARQFFTHPLGGRILVRDFAIGRKNDDGVEQCGKNDLRRLSGVDEFVGRGLPVEAQLAGHLVEGVGELAEFIVALHGQHLIEIAFAEFTSGVGQPLDGPQDDATQSVSEEQSQRQRGDHRHEHDLRGPSCRFAGMMILFVHRPLVDGLDGPGSFEQVIQRMVQVRAPAQAICCRR